MFRRISLAPIGELPTRRFLFVDSNEEAKRQTLASSPDEFVISQRGRRSLPVTWSPDENLRKQKYHNSSKKSVIPSASKMGSTLRSEEFKRRLLGPEDCFVSKSKLAKKTDSANMMTTRSNNKRVSFTPEKLDFTDLSTPLKFKLLVEKQHVKKPVFNLNTDVVSTSKSQVSGSRKRVLDNDGESSVSKVKRLKS